MTQIDIPVDIIKKTCLWHWYMFAENTYKRNWQAKSLLMKNAMYALFSHWCMFKDNTYIGHWHAKSLLMTETMQFMHCFSHWYMFTYSTHELGIGRQSCWQTTFGLLNFCYSRWSWHAHIFLWAPPHVNLHSLLKYSFKFKLSS